MRYHHKKPQVYLSLYGAVYICNHPLYDSCTLYAMDGKGLAVIQQRFDSKSKVTWWGDIDPWLIDSIYLHPRFKEYFDKKSGECKDGIFPTVTIRQIMWGLRMKPLKKERWETVFDRSDI